MAANTYALVRIPIVTRNCGYYLRWYYNGWHYWQFIQGGLSLTTEGQKYYTTGTRSITMNSGPLDVSQIEGLRTILNTTEIYLWTDAGWMVIRIESGSVKIYDNKFGGHDLTLTAIIGSRLPSITGFSPVSPIPVVPADGNFCETIIGNQIWMCKVWDGNYPGSKVYNNDEDNRASFGGLYTWDQVVAPGFIPTGWRVATMADWQELIDYINAQSVWHLPSNDELQLMYDNLHASALGGFASDVYWSSTEESSGGGYGLDFATNYFSGWDKSLTYHVRACRIFTATAGTYSIGDAGPEGGIIFYATGTTFGECAVSDQSASCAWSNIIAAEAGAVGITLGTGASNTTLIMAQVGHIDSAAKLCHDLISSNTTTGGKLKAIGTDFWSSPNTGAVDTYAFTAKGCGYMNPSGVSLNIFSVLNMWTADQVDALNAYVIQMTSDSAGISAVSLPKDYRFSVRMLKNSVPPTTPTFGFVTTIAGTFSMLVMGTGDIYINWGDGSVTETITLDPVYDGSLIQHVFTAGGTISITGNYNSITRIYAPSNEISAAYIPDTMVALYELHLNNNKLTAFTTHKEWGLIELLILGDNLLTEIDTYAEWVELRYFSVRNNTGISVIETHVEWVKLYALWVSNLSLTSIETFVEWVGMQYLYVYNNNLTSVDTFAEWTDLRQLRISNNQITAIDVFPEWTQLEYLFAENNLLTTIDLRAEWIKIDSIYLNGNPLTTLTFQSAWVLLFYFYAGDALDIATINDILTKADALGWTGATRRLYLNYGTNAAPTGAGATAKANLLSRGVDVLTN